MFYFESTSSFVKEYYGNRNKNQVRYILLIGNFERNIWALHRGYKLCLDTKELEMWDSFGNDIGFDIYWIKFTATFTIKQ
jgi:hypothetical protein